MSDPKREAFEKWVRETYSKPSPGTQKDWEDSMALYEETVGPLKEAHIVWVIDEDEE